MFLKRRMVFRFCFLLVFVQNDKLRNCNDGPNIQPNITQKHAHASFHVGWWYIRLHAHDIQMPVRWTALYGIYALSSSLSCIQTKVNVYRAMTVIATESILFCCLYAGHFVCAFLRWCRCCFFFFAHIKCTYLRYVMQTAHMHTHSLSLFVLTHANLWLYSLFLWLCHALCVSWWCCNRFELFAATHQINKTLLFLFLPSNE